MFVKGANQLGGKGNAGLGKTDSVRRPWFRIRLDTLPSFSLRFPLQETVVVLPGADNPLAADE